MQDVHITLTARQRTGGDWEETVYRYAGRCVEKTGGWYLTYKEQMEGAGEVSTTLKLGNGTVTLLRQGDVQTKQQFQQGTSHQTTYRSPYGLFSMETHTRKLRIRHEQGRPAQVWLAYQLWLNGQYVGEHELTLNVEWPSASG